MYDVRVRTGWGTEADESIQKVTLSSDLQQEEGFINLCGRGNSITLPKIKKNGLQEYQDQ